MSQAGAHGPAFVVVELDEQSIVARHSKHTDLIEAWGKGALVFEQSAIEHWPFRFGLGEQVGRDASPERRVELFHCCTGTKTGDKSFLAFVDEAVTDTTCERAAVVEIGELVE